VAFAQESPDEAVDFYRRGREHFAAGRYREAIADLERALILDPSSATLVYNLARVHELLGELDASIQYYNQYLGMLGGDETDERSRVEETLGRLQGARRQVAESGAQQTSGDLTTDPHELNRPILVEERGVADVPFWITAVGAVALLAGGGIVGIVALSEESAAETCILGATCTLAERDDAADLADNLALGADVLFVAGGVAAIAAGLLFALRTRQVETYPDYDATMAFFTADQHGALAGLRGTW
jgi:tetratricopeptide (TPR) repeat protein